MDFEDYVNYMAKKCQLAVATAVIKNKPSGLTTNMYIAQLREKVNEGNKEIVDVDLICSDDFDINENDFDYNEDSYSNVNLADTTSDISVMLTTDTQCDGIDDRNNFTNINYVQIGKNVSVDLLQDFNVPPEVTKMQKIATNEIDPTSSNHRSPSSNSLNEILETLRHIDEDTHEDQLTNIADNFTQDIFGEVSKIIPPPNNNLTEENMAIDNQPFVNLNIVTEDRENDFIIDERLKSKIARNIQTEKGKSNIQRESFNTNEVFEDFDIEIPRNVIDLSLDDNQESNRDFVKEKTAIVVKNIEREMAKNKQLDNDNYNIFNSQNLEENITQTNTSGNLACDTQKTIVYTLHGFTENTQISQSQSQNVEISNKFIFGSKINTNVNNLANNKNPAEIANEVAKVTTQDRISDSNKEILTLDSSQIQYIIDESGITYAVLKTISLKDNPKAVNTVNDDTEVENEVLPFEETDFDNISSHAGLNTKMNAAVVLDKQKDSNLQLNKSDHQNEYATTNTYDDQDDVEMTSQETAVPFKVVKELSKIKTFLNRRKRRASTDGFSSDSGYKSDSQGSFMSAHLSDNWMHQSAYCLYNYITQCPLVAATQDIVTEISQVLGRLIGKLHDDEKYPKFVEELLDKINSLLRELCEGDSSDDVLLQKDELTHRLLLLNKSTHILKFTIHKITEILEKTHTQLISEETLYELANVGEVENLCYLFNLLENLIQKFVKFKQNVTSQSSQNSLETRTLRKSSISEIWRRKWNPNVKEIRNVGSQEKGCCLEKCGRVLNKIIVECMDGYSLVSFAALQCFNVLQNQ